MGSKVPGVREWLRADYQREADAGDPRARFATDDPVKQQRLSDSSPHVRQMRRMVQRIDADEAVIVSMSRLRRCMLVHTTNWLVDHHGGVVVAPGDVLRPADHGAQVSP